VAELWKPAQREKLADMLAATLKQAVGEGARQCCCLAAGGCCCPAPEDAAPVKLQLYAMSSCDPGRELCMAARTCSSAAREWAECCVQAATTATSPRCCGTCW
jgi:hypothetical protein